MNVASKDLQDLCTKSELVLLRASQSPELAQWTAVELKRHAVLARKLADKWQGLARSQARAESRKSGSPNLQSRSQQKYEWFREALQAFETQLALAERTAPGSSGVTKETSATRNKQTREVRQSTRKDLLRTKQAINKTAAKPAAKKVTASTVAKSATRPSSKTSISTSGKSATKTRTKAAKKTSRTKKTAAPKRKVKGTKKPASLSPVEPVAKKPAAASKKAAVKVIAPATASSQRAISGKLKANRVAVSGRSSKIAGHVSAQGKRAQARRDAKR